MKKMILIALLLTSFIFAQDDTTKTTSSSSATTASGALAFGKGTKALGIGINMYTGHWTWNAALGITASFDVGAINDMISFGGDFTFWTDTWDYYYGYTGDARNNGMAFMFRGGFHPFGIPALQGKIKIANKMDPYVVIKMGADIVFWDDNYYTTVPGYSYDNTDGAFRFLASMGIRYYFTESFGVWAELDWDNFIGGVSFKF